jgi:hypothetical protein
MYNTNTVGSKVISPTDLVYVRKASTLTDPVPAGASDFALISWENPNYPSRRLILEALGTDQHDNSAYKWIIDGYELSISGPAAVGSVTNPMKLDSQITVSQSIKLLITNTNGVDYPNTVGSLLLDRVPYEGVFVGHWG